MDEARTLLELQDRDLKIMRLNKQLDEMPEKRAILAARSKIVEITDLLRRAEAVGHAVDARMSKLEDEQAAITQKMDHEQSKLLSGEVKNPKELTAISLELDSLKRRRETLENEELAEMAKRDTASQQAAKVNAAIEGGKVREAGLVAAFKSRGGDMVSELERLTAERTTLAASLAKETRERYESIRAAKHGIAVGSLEGDMCGVCRVSMPHERLERLLEGPDIAICPMCQRMLLVRKP
jgi:predicted  nucleic acid-binding Zn-ribbon protein